MAGLESISLPKFALPRAGMCRLPSFCMASSLHSISKEAKILKKILCQAGKVENVEVARPMPPEKMEIFKSMEDWARENVVSLLVPVEKSWQPQELLPDPGSDGFVEQVNELRDRTKEVPDDYFVVLVGNMITEEALPTYKSHMSATDVFVDDTGIDDTPWAIWGRGWTAEENRHGDLLNKYLYLSGRVDMKQVEKTIQYLIGSGMQIGTGRNPYHAAIYTSFQERATFISHANTAKLARKHGDTKLAQICGTIASDEKRHETAYTRIVGKLFELDPDETVIAFSQMMKKNISMPAHFMYDGVDGNLFVNYSSVASRIGVYTAKDYIEILEHLVDKWNVEKLIGLSREGQEAQDFVCELSRRFRRMEARARSVKAKETTQPTIPFSWIFGREA